MATPFKIVQTPAVALYSAISPSATSLVIAPYPVDLDGVKLTMTDFGTTGYMTVDPKVSGYEEIISFTGLTDNGNNTATLTGLTRDLSSKSPYTGAGTGKSHGSSAVVVFSNNPQVMSAYAAKANDETITGQWTFSVFPITPSTPLATTAAAGFVQVATQAQLLAKTALGGTGASLLAPPNLLPNVLTSDYKADTGTANAYAIAPSPAITAYVTGQIFSFKALNANTTTSTLNVSALGAKTIKYPGGANLQANSIIAGQLVVVEYDGTNFQMVSVPAYGPVDTQTFLASGTWTKPTFGTIARIQTWGAGGGGTGGGGAATGSNNCPGGGGGGYNERIIALSALGATETVTIGTGGTGGIQAVTPTPPGDGGNTTFGSWLTGYGGGGGGDGSTGTQVGGGGGGPLGAASRTTAGAPGSPFSGAGTSGGIGGFGMYSGGGAGATAGASFAGGNAFYGGAGGGSVHTTVSVGIGGTSILGGNGGAGVNGTGVAGSQPGGGGGGGSSLGGAGGDGKVVVTVW